MAEGQAVFASQLESGSNLNDVVDDNEATDSVSGTCATIGESDMPWLVVDMGQEMRVHGVTIKIPEEGSTPF